MTGDAEERLAREIAGFLSESGIRSEIVRDGSGLLLLRAKRTGGRQTGTTAVESDTAVEPDTVDIIPVEIAARTPEEASRCRKAVWAKRIGLRKRPIILAEDRWISEGDCIRKRLLAHMGVFTQAFARNCEVKKIHRDAARRFMDMYHSYGGTVCRYAYGLFLKKPLNGRQEEFPAGKMVAAATFSGGRLMERNGMIWRSYQWIRYASLPEMRVSGGMGKLLKHFMEEEEAKGEAAGKDLLIPGFAGWDMMSYADLEWSDGEAYGKLGFHAEGMKSPVTYRIRPPEWKREPLSRLTGEAPEEDALYFENFGSVRYRLEIRRRT